jgi:hypothetical protein
MANARLEIVYLELARLLKGSLRMAAQPITELDERYGEAGVVAAEWSFAVDLLEKAELFWLSTVRPEGRPHVTPLVGVWFDGAFYFCTGAHERKVLNLASNAECAVTTGTNGWQEGFDIVIEGSAERIKDHDRLQRIAGKYFSKYGSAWAFAVKGEGFVHDEGSLREEHQVSAYVFEVRPVTAFGFGKSPFSQTRWRF